MINDTCPPIRQIGIYANFWQINFVPPKLPAVQFLEIILFRLIGEATMNVIRGNTKPMDVIKLEVSMYINL